VTARYKAWVVGRSLAGTASSNPDMGGGVDSGRGLCDGLITRPEESYECGVSNCLREASAMSRWPTKGVATQKNFELCRPDLKLLHILLELWGFVISKINIGIVKSV
jgi:hypothetical protein